VGGGSDDNYVVVMVIVIVMVGDGDGCGALLSAYRALRSSQMPMRRKERCSQFMKEEAKT
jgi:hypothetical protein